MKDDNPFTLGGRLPPAPWDPDMGGNGPTTPKPIDDNPFTLGGGQKKPAARQTTKKINSLQRSDITIEATAENAPLPILYGEVTAPGYISAFFSDANYLYVRVIWGAGPIYQIKKVFINGAAMGNTIQFKHYHGTEFQLSDPWFDAGIPETAGVDRMQFTRGAGVLGVAFSTFAIPNAAITDSPRFQAIIQGTLVYDPRESLGSGDPYEDGVAFDLQFIGSNGTTPADCDLSTHNTSVTWTNGATIQGNMASFDGTNDYLTVTETAYTKFGTGKWTFEIKFTPSSTAGAAIIAMKGTDASPNLCFAIVRSGTSLYLHLSSAGTSWNIANGVLIGSGVSAGVESMVRVEYDGAGVYLAGDYGYSWVNILAQPTIYQSTMAWILGGVAGGYYAGTIRSCRLTTGIMRYGGAQFDGSGIPYADSWYYRPGYVYSDTPALCLAELALNPFYGLGVSIVNNLPAVYNWNEDELEPGITRARLSLVIDSNRPTEDYMDLLATYAECFWFYEDEGVTLVPDRAISALNPAGWEMTIDGALLVDASWTEGTGWGWIGVISTFGHSAGTASLVSQTITKTFEAGVVYVVRFDITYRTAGSCGLNLDGLPLIEKQSAVGVYTVEYTGLGTETGTVDVTCDAAFVGWVTVASIHRKYWPEASIVKNSLSLSGAAESGKPTKVIVHYTTPSASSPDWTRAVYDDAELPGVSTGTARLIETSQHMEGVWRVEEASLKARSKLARLADRVEYTWQSTDRAIAFQRGTVVELNDSAYGIDELVRVENVDMVDFGRYRVQGSNYSDEHYPGEVVLPDDNTIPVGVIAMSYDGLVPSGWQQFNGANGKLLLGAGSGYAVTSTGGSATCTVTGFNTSTSAAHSGAFLNVYDIPSDSGAFRQGSSGILSGTVMTASQVEIAGHNHAVTVSNYNPSIYKREKVLIEKITSAVTEMPANTEVFGIDGLSIPNLSRNLSEVGRLVAAALNNASAGSSGVQTIAATVAATDDTHDHYTTAATTTGSLISPTSGNYVYELGGSSHNHGGAISLSAGRLLRRRNFALYTGAAAYKIKQGVIFMWAGSLTAVPDNYSLMDGKLGTIDVTNYFIMVASSGESWTGADGFAGAHAEYIAGATNSVSHDHEGSYSASGLARFTTLHSNSISHNHQILTVASYVPAYYAIGFIMYNPNPTTSWIDRGLQLTVGGTNGGTTIDDTSPSNLTATVSGSPNYSSTQTLFGLNTIFNTTGDRLSYTSFDWGKKFTLEGFFRADTAATGEMMGNSTGAAEHFSIRYATGTGIQFVLDGSVNLTSASIAINTWFYVALTYDGALWRFYVGTQSSGVATLVGTAADVITSFATNCWIGNNNVPNSAFRGYFGEVRHTRGAAIYQSSAFAIPTASFPTS